MPQFKFDCDLLSDDQIRTLFKRKGWPITRIARPHGHRSPVRIIVYEPHDPEDSFDPAAEYLMGWCDGLAGAAAGLAHAREGV